MEYYEATEEQAMQHTEDTEARIAGQKGGGW